MAVGLSTVWHLMTSAFCLAAAPEVNIFSVFQPGVAELPL